MNRDELEVIRQNNAAIVKDVCSRFGVYGNVIYYEPSPIPDSSLNGMYIVAGLSPIFSKDQLPKGLRPDEMIQTITRNEKLFYPRAWALDLRENMDELSATQFLVDYCTKAATIAKLYGEYGLEPPAALRYSEVHQLISFRDALDNPHTSAAARMKCRADLDWFFKREKTKSKFRRNWLNYFRSEKFPDDKGPIAKIRGYFRRNQSVTSLAQLMEFNPDIRKLEMQEFEYNIFKKLIQERYPFVTYAVGDKDIVDHGISKANKIDETRHGKYVTAEEYAVIRKDRFADEGWDSVANLKQAYWEFRNIYYKECDEPLIASIYQHIVLQYAKPDSLADLKSRGALRMQRVPASDFMNFVSLAKANKLRFYIDTMGEYEKPSLKTINVLYNDIQQQKMDVVVDRMIQDKINFSSVLNAPSHPTLNSVIHNIEEKSRFHPQKHTRGEPPFQK